MNPIKSPIGLNISITPTFNNFNIAFNIGDESITIFAKPAPPANAAPIPASLTACGIFFPIPAITPPALPAALPPLVFANFCLFFPSILPAFVLPNLLPTLPVASPSFSFADPIKSAN